MPEHPDMNKVDLEIPFIALLFYLVVDIYN